MIRKRKSKINEQNEYDDENLNESFSFSKKHSDNVLEETINKEKKSKITDINNNIIQDTDINVLDKKHDIEKGSSFSTSFNKDKLKSNPLSEIKNLIDEKTKDINNKKFIKPVNDIINKYDIETKNLLTNVELFNFSNYFKNPFNPNFSRDEKITRLLYLSGYTFCPYFGWILASIYASVCKEKNTNKNIISIRFISGLQFLIIGLFFILLAAIISSTNQNVFKCKENNVIIVKKNIPNNKYNVVFFGPVSIEDWLNSTLSKIAESFNFNIYIIGFPNIIHHQIKSYKRNFLKDALKCAKLKASNVIIFSYQLETALNFTIPYLEKNESVLGFFSFNKKFKKEKPTKEKLDDTKIIYSFPKEKIYHDIYSSISLKICDSDEHYSSAFYVVNRSFNKYQIRCSKNLAIDYSQIVNNFNFNIIGDEGLTRKHVNSDFDDVIDDFYQYLGFINEIISKNNLEFYKKFLCENILCEDKGTVCAF